MSACPFGQNKLRNRQGDGMSSRRTDILGWARCQGVNAGNVR